MDTSKKKMKYKIARAKLEKRHRCVWCAAMISAGEQAIFMVERGWEEIEHYLHPNCYQSFKAFNLKEIYR
ncbi:MAG: hypothetical protein BWZ03_00733 [bacterium ADurb.BinA186]|nr:MAG: hypothetical protein BWZ03_00733 [bacterium ADurb.BinA186]